VIASIEDRQPEPIREIPEHCGLRHSPLGGSQPNALPLLKARQSSRANDRPKLSGEA